MLVSAANARYRVNLETGSNPVCCTHLGLAPVKRALLQNRELRAVFVAHSVYGAICEPQGIGFSLRGEFRSLNCASSPVADRGFWAETLEAKGGHT